MKIITATLALKMKQGRMIILMIIEWRKIFKLPTGRIHRQMVGVPAITFKLLQILNRMYIMDRLIDIQIQCRL